MCKSTLSYCSNTLQCVTALVINAFVETPTSHAISDMRTNLRMELRQIPEVGKRGHREHEAFPKTRVTVLGGPPMPQATSSHSGEHLLHNLAEVCRAQWLEVVPLSEKPAHKTFVSVTIKEFRNK